jgi:hypothetical protein
MSDYIQNALDQYQAQRADEMFRKAQEALGDMVVFLKQNPIVSPGRDDYFAMNKAWLKKKKKKYRSIDDPWQT